MKSGEPPEELWLAWQAKRWGYTPTEVMEQPAGLLTRMAIAWDAYEKAARAMAEFERQPTQNKAQWMKDNPELAAEWVRQSGIKQQMAAWREKQRRKREISG